MTKAYTLNRLIAEVSSLSKSEGATLASVRAALSPRAGTSSKKLFVLNAFLNGKFQSIASNSNYGSTAKARVLKALRARKRYGSDFSI